MYMHVHVHVHLHVTCTGSPCHCQISEFWTALVTVLTQMDDFDCSVPRPLSCPQQQPERQSVEESEVGVSTERDY